MQLFRVSKTESYFLSWGKGERRGKVLCFSVVFTPLFPSSWQVASFSQFWLSKPNVLLASKKLLGPESLVTVRAALAHHLTQAPAGREPMGRPAFLASPGLLRELTLVLLSKPGLFCQICKQLLFSCPSPGSMSSRDGTGKERAITSPRALAVPYKSSFQPVLLEYNTREQAPGLCKNRTGSHVFMDAQQAGLWHLALQATFSLVKNNTVQHVSGNPLYPTPTCLVQ